MTTSETTTAVNQVDILKNNDGQAEYVEETNGERNNDDELEEEVGEDLEI